MPQFYYSLHSKATFTAKATGINLFLSSPSHSHYHYRQWYGVTCHISLSTGTPSRTRCLLVKVMYMYINSRDILNKMAPPVNEMGIGTSQTEAVPLHVLFNVQHALCQSADSRISPIANWDITVASSGKCQPSFFFFLFCFLSEKIWGASTSKHEEVELLFDISPFPALFLL